MRETYRERYRQIKQKRRRRQQRDLATLVAVAFLAVIAVWMLSGSEDVMKEDKPVALPALNTTVPIVSMPLQEITDTRLLELVNYRNPIRREPDFDRFAIAWPDVPTQNSDLILYETVLLAADTWFRIASEEGIADFFILSGYRDIERQTEIYDMTENPSFVKPPGHSEHHTGLAMDVGIPGVSLGEMAGRAEMPWLAETAWEHGFILRYPESREHITGIAFEPWHFRYVGRLHAFYMWSNDLVLEQYLDSLRDREVITVTLESRIYEVWHQTPQDGKIYVPERLAFTVSTDNMGGYIVTVELE